MTLRAISQSPSLLPRPSQESRPHLRVLKGWRVQRQLPAATIEIALTTPDEPRSVLDIAPLDLPEAIPAPKPTPEWVRRPLRFRNYPPQPKRHYKPLPLPLQAFRAWHAEQFHQGAWRDERAAALLGLVKALPCDGVLYSGHWRLELVWLRKGYPHYRLYFRSYFYGKLDVPIEWGKSVKDARDLARLQQELARFLVGCGFCAETSALVEGDARTPSNAPKRALHRLFE